MTLITDHLLYSDQQRKKRQVPPIQVSLDDVLVIQPLRIVNDQLLVSFVVGGQEGQSAPVSGADVASLLQAEGPSLAMALSNVVCCIVLYRLICRSTVASLSNFSLGASEQW